MEPFSGAASYAFHHWEKEVILFDKDVTIVSLWKYLIQASYKDIMSLPILRPGESVNQFNLSNAEKALIGFSINQFSDRPKTTATSWKVWTEQTRERFAEDICKIRHWKVAQLDFRKVSEHPFVKDKGKISWFIDPPYWNQGKWYKCKMGLNEYIDLAKLVHVWPGQVIVCDNMNAPWLPFEPLVETKGMRIEKNIEGVYVTHNDLST